MYQFPCGAAVDSLTQKGYAAFPLACSQSMHAQRRGRERERTRAREREDTQGSLSSACCVSRPCVHKGAGQAVPGGPGAPSRPGAPVGPRPPSPPSVPIGPVMPGAIHYQGRAWMVADVSHQRAHVPDMGRTGLSFRGREGRFRTKARATDTCRTRTSTAAMTTHSSNNTHTSLAREALGALGPSVTVRPREAFRASGPGLSSGSRGSRGSWRAGKPNRAIWPLLSPRHPLVTMHAEIALDLLHPEAGDHVSML